MSVRLFFLLLPTHSFKKSDVSSSGCGRGMRSPLTAILHEESAPRENLQQATCVTFGTMSNFDATQQIAECKELAVALHEFSIIQKLSLKRMGDRCRQDFIVLRGVRKKNLQIWSHGDLRGFPIQSCQNVGLCILKLNHLGDSIALMLNVPKKSRNLQKCNSPTEQKIATGGWHDLHSWSSQPHKCMCHRKCNIIAN